VLATGVKAGRPGVEKFEELLLHWCARLNRGGAMVIRELGLKAATDVTGFGLGGHLLEMAQSSGVCAELDLAAVPFFPEALDLANQGFLPGGSVCNRNHYMARSRVARGLEDLRVALAFDAQTSGGLILGVPEALVPQAQALLAQSGDLSARIGRAVAPLPTGQALSLI